jgi:5-methylcytosine-specific restriction endonuclease McrA
MQRKHAYVEIVAVGEPCVKSRAAYVKLCRRLMVEDGRNIYNTKNSKQRKKFIKKVKKGKGELRCVYCDKELVEWFAGMKKADKIDRMVTIDHIIPQGKGGAKYDQDNMAICCPVCNNLKGDMRAEDFHELIAEGVQ